MNAVPEELPSYLRHNYMAMADLEDEYRLDESDHYGSKSLMQYLRGNKITELIENGMQEIFRLTDEYMTSRMDADQEAAHSMQITMEGAISAVDGYVKKLIKDKVLDGELKDSVEEALAYGKGSARLAVAKEAITAREAVDRFLNEPFADYNAGLAL